MSDLRACCAAALVLLCACHAVSGLDVFETAAPPQGDGGEASAGGGGEGGAGLVGGAGGVGGEGPAGGEGGDGGAGGVASFCGDGVIDEGEECDAGGEVDDGCVSCEVVCDGLKHPTTFHCYRYIQQYSTWSQAEQACQGRGPGWHLAAISSQAERSFIDDNGLVVAQSWIGGIDEMEDNVFTWTNGEPWGFAPWYPGNPDFGTQCITYVATLGFVDRNCQEQWLRVCELTPAGE